jgi:hypothetical protein
MTLVLRYKTTIGQDELPTAQVNVSNLGITIQYAQASLYDGANTEVPKLTYVNRQNEGQITAGDEVAIDTEHFYVVSSDSTNTVLLAKYNLLVGNVYNQVSGSWSKTKTLTSSDTGYGLQNENAKGYYGTSATDRTGVVAFSGKGYWDNKNCVWSGSGNATTCPGTAGLKSEYANASNAEGKTGAYSSPYPYVYNSTMSSIAPEHGIYYSPWGYAQDNGYTIAYYVEEYVNRLGIEGEGRLLTYTEFNAMTTAQITNGARYWLGSASYSVRYVAAFANLLSGISFDNVDTYGVRPVIIVSTSDIGA